MTIKEIIALQHGYYNSKVYLMLQGSFYHAYNEGASFLSRIIGYKLRRRNGYSVVGFPISSLTKVVKELEKVSYNNVVTVEPLEEKHVVLTVT